MSDRDESESETPAGTSRSRQSTSSRPSTLSRRSKYESPQSLSGFEEVKFNNTVKSGEDEETQRAPRRTDDVLFESQVRAPSPEKDFFHLQICNTPDEEDPIIFVDEIPISARNINRRASSVIEPRTSTIGLTDFANSKSSQDDVERIFGKDDVESIIQLAKDHEDKKKSDDHKHDK